MATVKEVREALNGLPDDALFGVLCGVSGTIGTMAVRENITTMEFESAGTIYSVAAVLEQDKHDTAWELTEEQADVLFA